jgi:hypothetical protein
MNLGTILCAQIASTVSKKQWIVNYAVVAVDSKNVVQ